ncbi:MAG: hypothetical protein Q8Q32_03170 [bacterium]|nr:hypothetical protein [bacterium]
MSYSRGANGLAILALLSVVFIAVIFFYFNKLANDVLKEGANIEYYAKYLPN